MTLVGPLPLYLAMIALVFFAGFILGRLYERRHIIQKTADIAYPGGDGTRPQVVRVNRIALWWRRWRGWRKAEKGR